MWLSLDTYWVSLAHFGCIGHHSANHDLGKLRFSFHTCSHTQTPTPTPRRKNIVFIRIQCGRKRERERKRKRKREKERERQKHRIYSYSLWERKRKRKKLKERERERERETQTQTQADNHIRSYLQDAQDRTENEANQKRGEGRALHLPPLAVLGLFLLKKKISSEDMDLLTSLRERWKFLQKSLCLF